MHYVTHRVIADAHSQTVMFVVRNTVHSQVDNARDFIKLSMIMLENRKFTQRKFERKRINILFISIPNTVFYTVCFVYQKGNHSDKWKIVTTIFSRQVQQGIYFSCRATCSILLLRGRSQTTNAGAGNVSSKPQNWALSCQKIVILHNTNLG